MSYASTQDTDTPLSRWKFEEVAGTTIDDDKTATRDGTITGGVTLNQPAGYTDPALGADFNGTTGFVTVGNASGLLGIGTIEAVVKFDTIPASARQIIFMHNWASGTIPLVLGFNVDNSHAGLIQVGYYTGSVWQVATWTSAPTTGIPYHVVGKYDGTTLKLRVNGTEVASTTVTTTRATSGTVNATAFIGKFYTGSAFFDGTIWDLAIYASALSDLRIDAHYTTLANPYADNFASAGVATLGRFVDIDTSGWTTEGSEPGSLDKTGWATITPTTTNLFTFSTVGSNYDTVVNVYSGSSIGALTLIAGDDDSGGSGTSLFTTSLTGGATYYIQVGAKSGGSGGLLTFQLDQRSQVQLTSTHTELMTDGAGQTGGRPLTALTSTHTEIVTDGAGNSGGLSRTILTSTHIEILTPARKSFVGWGIAR